MAIYVVEYVYAKGSKEVAAAMDTTRPAHRAFLRGLVDEGIVKVVGPSPSPEGDPGAYVIAEADSPEAVFDALAADPFYVEGFITDRICRELTVVAGGFAS